MNENIFKIASPKSIAIADKVLCIKKRKNHNKSIASS